MLVEPFGISESFALCKENKISTDELKKVLNYIEWRQDGWFMRILKGHPFSLRQLSKEVGVIQKRIKDKQG